MQYWITLRKNGSSYRNLGAMVRSHHTILSPIKVVRVVSATPKTVTIQERSGLSDRQRKRRQHRDTQFDMTVPTLDEAVEQVKAIIDGQQRREEQKVLDAFAYEMFNNLNGTQTEREDLQSRIMDELGYVRRAYADWEPVLREFVEQETHRLEIEDLTGHRVP